MANVAHSTLTGSELHEPKGADTAALGTVYVANGAGSGSWSSIGTSAFTGMIADFAAPVAPIGWLELNGAVISTTTYSGLFAVMSMTTTGTRTNGSPVITSIPSTTNMVAGYYVFGTGIASGTTILTVDSATQITLSGNASSSGTSSFFVSPFLMNTGTITLPNVTTAGRYRRSRIPGTNKVGDILADQNKTHTHTVSGTTNASGTHTHANTLNNPAHSHDLFPSHTARVIGNAAAATGTPYVGIQLNNGDDGNIISEATTTAVSINNVAGGDHTHTVTGTAAADGGDEARPVSMIVLTCIKT